jgi:hypothetical protein
VLCLTDSCIQFIFRHSGMATLKVNVGTPSNEMWLSQRRFRTKLIQYSDVDVACIGCIQIWRRMLKKGGKSIRYALKWNMYDLHRIEFHETHSCSADYVKILCTDFFFQVGWNMTRGVQIPVTSSPWEFFFTMAPNVCAASVWIFFHVTLLEPRLWSGFYIFGKCVHPWL